MPKAQVDSRQQPSGGGALRPFGPRRGLRALLGAPDPPARPRGAHSRGGSCRLPSRCNAQPHPVPPCCPWGVCLLRRPLRGLTERTPPAQLYKAAPPPRFRAGSPAALPLLPRGPVAGKPRALGRTLPLTGVRGGGGRGGSPWGKSQAAPPPPQAARGALRSDAHTSRPFPTHQRDCEHRAGGREGGRRRHAPPPALQVLRREEWGSLLSRPPDWTPRSAAAAAPAPGISPPPELRFECPGRLAPRGEDRPLLGRSRIKPGLDRAGAQQGAPEPPAPGTCILGARPWGQLSHPAKLWQGKWLVKLLPPPPPRSSCPCLAPRLRSGAAGPKHWLLLWWQARRLGLEPGRGKSVI